KTGSKLHQSTVAEESGVEKPLITGRRGDLSAERITVAQLAEALARELNSPVSDMTGIQGVFELHLQWTPESNQIMNKLGGDQDVLSAAEHADGTDIFTA